MKIIEKFEKAKIKVKANYNSMGPDFGDKLPKIIGHLMKESDAALLSHLSKGEYKITIDDSIVSLKKEHFNITTELPPEFAGAEFKSGNVYLDRTRDKELDSEGFAREIMRRVQSLRKKQGLQKSDRIKLCVTVDKELEEMLSSWHSDIADKVGASEIFVGQECKGYPALEKGKIKDKVVDVCFEKI
jgi:isoleucyl-tRNA synthetase